jgi:hypothetical protein
LSKIPNKPTSYYMGKIEIAYGRILFLLSIAYLQNVSSLPNTIEEIYNSF